MPARRTEHDTTDEQPSVSVRASTPRDAESKDWLLAEECASGGEDISGAARQVVTPVRARQQRREGQRGAITANSLTWRPVASPERL